MYVLSKRDVLLFMQRVKVRERGVKRGERGKKNLVVILLLSLSVSDLNVHVYIVIV